MRLFIVLLGIVLLLGVLIYRFPYALDSEEQRIDIVYGLLLLVMVSVGLFSRPEISWKKHGQYALAWIAILLVLMVGYSFRDELAHSRFLGELFPSQAHRNAAGEIVLHASEDGHFYMEALVNHAPIRFLVDTGASGISLSRRDAKRAGIDVDALVYNIPHTTANGVSFNASSRIELLEAAGLGFRDLPVSINAGRMEGSLLGLTFLRKMQNYRVEGDTLTLVP